MVQAAERASTDGCHGRAASVSEGAIFGCRESASNPLIASGVAPTVQCSALRACALPASPLFRARGRSGRCARNGGRPSLPSRITRDSDAQHTRPMRRQPGSNRSVRNISTRNICSRALRALIGAHRVRSAPPVRAQRRAVWRLVPSPGASGRPCPCGFINCGRRSSSHGVPHQTNSKCAQWIYFFQPCSWPPTTPSAPVASR